MKDETLGSLRTLPATFSQTVPAGAQAESAKWW